MRLQEVIIELNFYQTTNPLNKTNIPSAEISKFTDESFTELKKIHSGLIGIINISNRGNLNDRGELYELVGSVEEHVSSNFPRNIQIRAILAFIRMCAR